MVKLLVIILIVLIVDIIGGYIIGVKVIIPIFYKTEELVEYNELSREEEEGGEAPRVQGIEKALDAINLNPADSIGEIFACDIVLAAEEQIVIDEITIRNYEIMDKLATYLSFKTVEELNNPNNWEKYKEDMFGIVNDSLASGKILYLYVPSKIIQYE